MLEDQFVKDVRARSLKARAMRFRHPGKHEELIKLVRRIESCLGVKISLAGDQGAIFCHLRIDDMNSPILSDGDWVVVDSFRKVSIVKDREFNVYYEAE